MAYGIVKAAHPDWNDEQCWDKICIIDTENGSASLYANKTVGNFTIGEFYTLPMKAPFEPIKYMDYIHAAEQSGIEVLIIDSLSMAWVGEGGSLDKQGKIASRTGNSYTAWRDITPDHNKMIDTILQSTCHVICNFRAKQEYIQTKDNNGKTVIKNMGLGLQFRDSVEYELSTLLMIDSDHVANATKDRTGLFDGKYFVISPETGKEIYHWLQSGEPEKVPAPVPEKVESSSSVTVDMVDQVIRACCEGKSKEEKQQIVAQIKEMTGGTADYRKVSDPTILENLYNTFK